MILLALWSRPLHGYGIRRQIRAFSRGRVQLGNGTVYETLPRLEQIEWIRAAPDPKPGPSRRERHLYELTETGRKVLQKEHARLCQLCALLTSYGVPDADEADSGPALAC